MLSGIIEYVDVVYDKDHLIRKHNVVRGAEALEYIECGTESHVLVSNPDYYRHWDYILTWGKQAAPVFCEHGTGFNLNGTLTAGVPPHIDIGNVEGNQFNLLLPMFGKAMIGIYETIPSQLEYRHGKTHWNMLQDKYPSNKIGEILVDKPVLLNTEYLHDVRVVEAPRAIFCFAWRGINKTYNEFKEHVEKTYT